MAAQKGGGLRKKDVPDLHDLEVEEDLSGFVKNSERVRELAVKSMLDHYARLSPGMIIVDKDARIVWLNPKYAKLLGKDLRPLIGRKAVDVIPNTLMHRIVETGEPIMLDIQEIGDEILVVTRIPIKDSEGKVIGGVGMTLTSASELNPMVSRYRQLLNDLDSTRRHLADARRCLADARRTRYTLSSFVADDPACLELKRLARKAARIASPVLLLGETGTGKELLAQAIHATSPRADRPFIAINLAAIPESLLEAEFFGVSPGAYTGAEKKGREGKVKLADGGTLFLDEVGDMSPSLQAKLLRVLQEKEVEPLGSNQLVPVDVRIIAATSRDLPRMVGEGSFRADLYYRLNVLTLKIPPLRERLDDLPALCERLLEQLCLNHGLPPIGISSSALARLRQHDWPGNVRELNNVLERALLHNEGEMIEASVVEHFFPELTAHTGRGEVLRPASSFLLKKEQARFDREMIEKALRLCGGNKTLAARKLGIARATLYQKLAACKAEPESGD